MLSRTLNKISRAIFDISDAQRKQRSKNPIPSQIFDFLIDLSAFCAALLVLGMAVTIGLNVLLRKVFLAPIEWALPMTEFSLLYITFLAAPVVLRREGHVRMSAITEQLGHEWKVRLYILGSSIGFLVCAILVWQSASATWKEIQSGAVLLQGIEVRRALVTWIIPYGFGLLGIQFFRMGYNVYRTKILGSEPRETVG